MVTPRFWRWHNSWYVSSPDPSFGRGGWRAILTCNHVLVCLVCSFYLITETSQTPSTRTPYTCPTVQHTLRPAQYKMHAAQSVGLQVDTSNFLVPEEYFFWSSPLIAKMLNSVYLCSFVFLQSLARFLVSFPGYPFFSLKFEHPSSDSQMKF